jgi:ADP-ribosylglycohydrolase
VPDRRDAIAGAVLGTAVGDALGLPREGLSRRRAARWYGDEPLRHRLVFGRGLISDDTEHTCMVAQALLASGGEEQAFARSLAWRLRGWLLGLPAGVGFGTLRAVLKLWLGFPPSKSGVFTAGNGPAMRAPVLGACLGDTPAVRALVRASTRLTHTDPKAEEGALLVALATAWGAARGPGLDATQVHGELVQAAEGDDLRRALDLVGDHLRTGSDPEAFAEALGQPDGISGYVNHTVPAVLFCWLRSPESFEEALSAVIRLGGDADTTGAILGGIAGATVGAEAIPAPWIDGIAEWPRTTAWLRRLADRLATRFPEGQPADGPGPLPLFWPGIGLRNLVFLKIVLSHGFRRLLPPY